MKRKPMQIRIPRALSPAERNLVADSLAAPEWRVGTLKPNPKLSPRNAEIVALHDAGWTTRQLAERFQMTTIWIRVILKRAKEAQA
jgi:hypothetical protein